MTSSKNSASGYILDLQDLKKYFPLKKNFWGRSSGAVRALDGINLSVAAGETIGLVGESGCGKTTLGRVILKLIPATAGSISFEGIDVLNCNKKSLHKIRRQMQIVFQNP